MICDDLPNQMTFVSAKGSTFKNGKACWTRKSVAKGATLTFRVVARVDANVGNVKLVNVATATASNAKPATADGTGSRPPQRAHSRRRRHRLATTSESGAAWAAGRSPRPAALRSWLARDPYHSRIKPHRDYVTLPMRLARTRRILRTLPWVNGSDPREQEEEVERCPVRCK